MKTKTYCTLFRLKTGSLFSTEIYILPMLRYVNIGKRHDIQFRWIIFGFDAVFFRLSPSCGIVTTNTKVFVDHRIGTELADLTEYNCLF